MSQEDVRRLLVTLGGEASLKELSDLARERYPKRSLHAYLGERLKSMERKEIVEKSDDKTSVWRLTESGLQNKIGDFSFDEIDDTVGNYDLKAEGIKITNIVGCLKLDRRLSLEMLVEQIPNTEYHPETSPGLVYRDEDGEGVTVLAHSSGRLSIAGAENKRELMEGTKNFLNVIRDLGIETEKSSKELLIENIVANLDLGREFDLVKVASDIGLENVEYDPEQFPGLIYRSKTNSTVLIYNSGKCVITGAKTFAQILDAYREITDGLVAMGIML